MRITALEAFRIDERIIELWRQSGHEELLPIQELAVREGGVLAGKNVLVFSPTSSGKTFVGEMAAVQMAMRHRRAVYLVPQTEHLSDDADADLLRSPLLALNRTAIPALLEHKVHTPVGAE